MRIVEDATPLSTAPRVVTIGNFDGVHLGHRHLISQLVARARALGAPSCVYTFEPPPRVVLTPPPRPEEDPDGTPPAPSFRSRILPWPDKLRLLGEAGVDQVVVERFTRAFAQHPPEWFVTEVLGRRLGARAFVVGYDFRCGRARAGDASLLRALLPDVPVEQVGAHAEHADVVSSSRIRRLVAAGDVAEAAALLGRPHTVRGTVVAGDQRGRTIGFPTANLESDAELTPASGVYAVFASVDRGTWRPAVANLGTRPTFDGRRFLIEVHLLDVSLDLYGRELTVAFVDRLRPEQRFPDLDALAARIRVDVEAARARLAAAPGPAQAP